MPKLFDEMGVAVAWYRSQPLWAAAALALGAGWALGRLHLPL